MRTLLAAALVAAAALPAGAAPCAGPLDSCAELQPGVRLLVGEEEYPCVAGWVLRGADRARYVLTTGDCTLGQLGTALDLVYPRGEQPVVRLPGGRVVGHVLYVHLQSNDGIQLRNLGLIRLLPGVRVDPAVCGIGRVKGIDTSNRNRPVTFELSGYGTELDWMGVEEDVTPRVRSGVFVQGTMNPALAHAEAPLQSNGDAGAPVLVDGLAFGIHSGIPNEFGVNASTIGSPVFRLPALLRYVKLRLGLDLALEV